MLSIALVSRAEFCKQDAKQAAAAGAPVTRDRLERSDRLIQDR
jgi:hypothetical protein